MHSSIRRALSLVLLLVCVAVADAQRSGRRQGSFPRGFGGRDPDAADSLYAVVLPEVQREIEVRPEQEKLLEALMGDLFLQRREVFRRAFRRSSEDREEDADQDDRGERVEAFHQNSEKLLAAILDPRQAARFHELRLQLEGARALRRPEVVSALELSEQQQQEIRDAIQASSTRRGRRGDDDSEEIKQRVLSILTNEQQKRWVKVQGASFAFPTLENLADGRRFPRSQRDRDDR